MSFCKDCFKGAKHEGIPEGKIVTIGEVKCYVATPTVDYPKEKVLLFLPDVFGLELVNFFSQIALLKTASGCSRDHRGKETAFKNAVEFLIEHL